MFMNCGQKLTSKEITSLLSLLGEEKRCSHTKNHGPEEKSRILTIINDNRKNSQKTFRKKSGSTSLET